MSFMQPEIIRGRGFIVEITDGSSFVIPAALVDEEPTGRHLMQYAPEGVGTRYASHEEVRGFFAHMTAPGYLDQTDWEYFATQSEVDAWEAEQEDEDEDEEDDDDDDDDEGEEEEEEEVT